MKIIARPSRTRLPAGTAVRLPLLVEVKAPQMPDNAARPAVSVLAVVDVSGSMAGPKLAAVRQALGALCDHLVVGDSFGLVSFSTAAKILLPLVEVTEAVRDQIRSCIGALSAERGTNLAAGLRCAFGLVRRRAEPSRTRTIVLTDGNATEGVAITRIELADLARAELAGTLSAFGYGTSCDHGLLGDLVQVGNGSYAFINNHDDVLTAFSRELGGLISTYATDVVVSVRGPFGDSAQRFGSVLQEGVVRHAMMLELPARALERGLCAAEVEVQFRNRRGEMESHQVAVHVDIVQPEAADTDDVPEVLRAIAHVQLGAAMERAEKLAQDDQFEAACAELELLYDAIADEGIRRFIRWELIPAYERPNFNGTAAFRTSFALAARGTRQVVAESRVAAMFDLDSGDKN